MKIFKNKNDNYQLCLDPFDEYIYKDRSKYANYIFDKYSDSIMYSAKNTIIFENNYEVFTNADRTTFSISVEDLDTTSAIFKYSENGSVVALNFANYLSPGGGFLYGALAQEEMLCMESTLFPVLMYQYDEYYDIHYDHKNIYLDSYMAGDDMMYSPDVLFIKGGSLAKADIITAAAPALHIENSDFYKEYDYTEDTYYTSILYLRIKKILEISGMRDCDTLILGAFGCGAFQNDPKLVSGLFKKALDEVNIKAKHVVFAIPKKYSEENFECFYNTIL